MLDLKNSGYDEKDRYRILRGGIKTHKDIEDKEKQGLKHYFRAPDPNKIMKNTRKNNEKCSWYKGKRGESKFRSVMFD